MELIVNGNLFATSATNANTNWSPVGRSSTISMVVPLATGQTIKIRVDDASGANACTVSTDDSAHIVIMKL